jgi:hypothetical protein
MQIICVNTTERNVTFCRRSWDIFRLHIIATSVLNTILENVSAVSVTRYMIISKQFLQTMALFMQATTKTRKCLFILLTKMVVQPSRQALELVVPPDR